MPIVIRDARPDDEARVLDLLGQLFQLLDGELTADGAPAASFRRMLANPERGRVLVADEDGAVLGVISFSYNLAIRFPHAYAQIEELVVDEAARGKQAGALLVKACIERARADGCNEMGLYPREETRAFYEKLGFRYVGVELRQAL